MFILVDDCMKNLITDVYLSILHLYASFYIFMNTRSLQCILVIFHNQNLDNGPFLFMHKISHSVLVWSDFLNNTNVLCKSSLKDMTVGTMCPLL